MLYRVTKRVAVKRSPFSNPIHSFSVATPQFTAYYSVLWNILSNTQKKKSYGPNSV